MRYFLNSSGWSDEADPGGALGWRARSTELFRRKE